MLLERKELTDTQTGERFVEGLYDSSNIMKSIYIPERQLLFIFFKKGIVYSYYNVDTELYLGLEMADSQGVYFAKNINKNKVCQYFREFKLYEFEKKDMLTLIEEHKTLLDKSNKG
jgi:hypothetical protein